MSVTNTLLDAIKNQREEGGKKRKFKGEFIDYLKLVEKNPVIVQTAHRRLYDTLISHGSERKVAKKENLRVNLSTISS